MDTAFQAEVHRLRASHSADELRFLTSLGPLAAKVQAPVFEQFGLPPGQRGVILMKMGVRLLSMVAPDIKELAGDLREMLCLPREEEDISSTIKKAESDLTALLEYPFLRIIQPIKRQSVIKLHVLYLRKSQPKAHAGLPLLLLWNDFWAPSKFKSVYFAIGPPIACPQFQEPSHPICPPGIPSAGAEDRFSTLGRPGALGRSIPAAIQGQSYGDCTGHPWIAEASQRAGEASYGPSGICLGTFFWIIFIEKSSI